MFCEEARLSGMLEQHLLSSLHQVRQHRAKADEFIGAIIHEAELHEYTPEQWRVLLAGLEERVAESRARQVT